MSYPLVDLTPITSIILGGKIAANIGDAKVNANVTKINDVDVLQSLIPAASSSLVEATNLTASLVSGQIELVFVAGNNTGSVAINYAAALPLNSLTFVNAALAISDNINNLKLTYTLTLQRDDVTDMTVITSDTFSNSTTELTLRSGALDTKLNAKLKRLVIAFEVPTGENLNSIIVEFKKLQLETSLYSSDEIDVDLSSLPTLAEIEASSVLAKASNITALRSSINELDTAADGLATSASANSTAIAAIKTVVDNAIVVLNKFQFNVDNEVAAQEQDLTTINTTLATVASNITAILVDTDQIRFDANGNVLSSNQTAQNVDLTAVTNLITDGKIRATIANDPVTVGSIAQSVINAVLDDYPSKANWQADISSLATIALINAVNAELASIRTKLNSLTGNNGGDGEDLPNNGLK